MKVDKVSYLGFRDSSACGPVTIFAIAINQLVDIYL